MKSIYTKIFTILILIASGCDDDLQLTPVSSLSGPSFFQNEDDARSAVNGMYSQMRGISDQLFLYGDERADNTEQTDLGTGNDVNRNTLKVTTGGTDWGGFYSLIKDANLILDKVPGITFTDEAAKNDLLAQAYFVRAWAYFMIVRIWGDAPLLLDAFESPNQEGILPGQRDPASDLFAQIKSDIETSIGLFSDDGVGDRYSASKPAANMLKADVFLWTAKLEGGGTTDLNTALSAINQVIGHPDLGLLDDYLSVFRPTSATNEDILSMFRDLDEGGGFFAGRYNLQDASWAQLSEEDKARIPLIRGSARFFTTTQIFRDQIIQNANGNTDPREKVYFLEYQFAGETRHVMNKYEGEEIAANLRQFTDDNKLYRYAEAILMHAEIVNALGNTAEAVADLNLIRNRVGIGDYAGGMSREEVDAAILQEKGIELAFEAKRFFDLVRFGKAFELVPSLVGREGEQPILWPISQNTLSLNPNLEQTQGY